MKKFPFRQIHLDFHTSEKIEEIGLDFSKEQFQSSLKRGHVDSITVFAKCHHGMFYYPSKKYATHPFLKKNLLKEMIEAAHEINVNVPVYISAGFDEIMAREHPEWLYVGDKNNAPTFMRAGYHLMCFNTPYLDLLVEQTKEVVENFDADGIFLDIIGIRPCYCRHCIDTLLKNGKNPDNYDDAKELAEQVYAKYYTALNDAIHSIKPNMRIFHNFGHIQRGRRDIAKTNTHLEIESLPTGGWGYDHFPMAIRYAQQIDENCLGMTGKFHTSWGEFGGYKHPNALIYEVSLSLAMGSKCSIGDQLHPLGKMDDATYDLIGQAYKHVEERQEWCDDVENIADIGILSQEAFSHGDKGDKGANRIMLEGKFLYNILDMESDFNSYKLIILPDSIKIVPKLKEKLDIFIKNGGKILATGQSNLNENGTEFVYDLGAKYIGNNAYKPDFIEPAFNIKNLINSAYIVYSDGIKIEANGEVLAWRADSYFNRNLAHFCSHQHTPVDLKKAKSAGITQGKDGIYVSWKLFEDYAEKGSYPVKEILINIINVLLGDKKTLETDLYAQGVVSLMHQKNENRYINHILYAAPVKRGSGIEIIEDILPIYDINVSLKINKQIKKVYFAPNCREIDFIQKDDNITYKIDKHWCHSMIVLEY